MTSLSRRGADQSLRNRARESVKLGVRGLLQKADVEIGRGTFANRLARTCDAFGIDTVLDVGANVGQYATMLRRAGFAGRILSCEPLTGAFGELASRADGDARWQTLHTAVGAEPGTVSIHVSENSFSSSIRDRTDAHLDNAPGSHYIATEEVPVTTVAGLVDTHGVDPARCLLKIDTQGYEGEVLRGAGELVGRVQAIQLEMSFVELYAGQLLYDDLMAAMVAAGYRLHTLDPGFSAADGRLLQVDGLFVRADAGSAPSGA